jgi:uncharacterized protein (TIGR00369 family)
MVKPMSETDRSSEATDLLQRAIAARPAFAAMLGATLTHVALDRLVAELPVPAELGNVNGVLHGGALMALADNLGGTATMLNLPPNSTTATIESKTNFLAAIKIGDVAHAECVPLHRGRATMVWETRITRGDGRLAAIVTQTQMVIAKR